LRRFFAKVTGGYQISKTVRELCIFAKQNVAKDPPFSGLDLISCRNVLIYLNPVLQKRVDANLPLCAETEWIPAVGRLGTTSGFENLSGLSTESTGSTETCRGRAGRRSIFRSATIPPVKPRRRTSRW